MDPLLWKQGILVIGGRCPLDQLRGQRGKIGSEKRLVSGILQKSLYSLLSGLGPGWEFTLQPQGYVQGAVRETAESLSINTTRCTAVLELTVTVSE